MSTKREQGRQSQKWCKTCNLWIADNKVQIEQHENGSKHRTATEKLLKDIAKKNEAKRRDEQAKESTTETKKRKASQAAADLLTHVTKFSHVPVRHENDLKVKENPQEEDDFVKVETTETDENGYPLPAEKVYGEWTVVEDENHDDDEENDEKPDEKNKENKSVDKEEKEDETVHTRAIFEGAFKKRVVSGNRRKRRRR